MDNIRNLGIVTDTHVYFYGGVFSNWYPSKFRLPVKLQQPLPKFMVDCSEQALMYYKAIYFNDTDAATAITIAQLPRTQKKLGRQVENYVDEEWVKVRYGLMVDILQHKFSQNPELAIILLLTGDRVLVEASPTDEIWGIGLGLNDCHIYDESKWRGENLLGKALMEVRDFLRG